MSNPLWVDARDLLTSQGHQLNTYNLNHAMEFLANNPSLRPSVVKAGGSGNEAAIGAGLGAPTDQIVSTPLAPPQANRSSPAKPSGAGGGRSGASVGGSTRTRPAPAPPVAKPDPLQALMAPEVGGPEVPRAEQAGPSSPVAPASAAPADAGSSLTGGRLAVGAAGLTALLVALLGARGGRTAGARPASAEALAGARPYGTPDAFANPADMPMQRYGTADAFADPLAGMKPYGTPGAMDAPPDPLEQLLPYGTPGAMSTSPPNQSPVPYSGEAPATAPPQLAGLIDEMIHGQPAVSRAGIPEGTPAPGSLEEIIAQLTNQTPTGQSPAPPQLPPSLPPGGKPMRNIMGTTRGTKAPKR